MIQGLQIFNTIVLQREVRIAGGLGIAIALGIVAVLGGTGAHKGPEILPGHEAPGKVLMSRGRRVYLLQIRKPLVSYLLIKGKPIHPGAGSGALRIVPGIAHTKRNRQSLGRGRIHDPVQLFEGIAVVAAVTGLKFPPGEHQDNAVEAVGTDLGQLCLHVIRLAVPEVAYPVIGIVGCRFQVAAVGLHEAAAKQKCQDSQQRSEIC